MGEAELLKMLEALVDIAVVLERIGFPGLVLLTMACPALVLCVTLVVEYHKSRKIQDIVENCRAQSLSMLETYRSDTQNILRELGAGLDRTDQYYRNNVELVRQYERISKGLQNVVVSNTRAVERLVTMIENKQ